MRGSLRSGKDLPKKKKKNTSYDKQVQDTRYEEAHLNPKYTFDTFVVGSNNKFAQAAALLFVKGKLQKSDKIRGLKNTACFVVFIFYHYVDYAYGLRNIIHKNVDNLWITSGLPVKLSTFSG